MCFEYVMTGGFRSDCVVFAAFAGQSVAPVPTGMSDFQIDLNCSFHKYLILSVLMASIATNESTVLLGLVL